MKKIDNIKVRVVKTIPPRGIETACIRRYPENVERREEIDQDDTDTF